MKYIVYIFLLFPILVTAQTYKYIGIENGLSNRRIFNIQKDDQGYMWFLTNEGMDRYNGKDIKHYKLNKDNNSVASQIHLGWLYATPEAGLWVIGRKGRLFQYEKQYDRFTIGYKLPDISKTISYGYVDHNNNIWLCCNDSIVLYNIKNAHTFQFPNILHSNITAIEQIDDNHFFIATETGVRYAKLENGALQIIPTETLDYFHTQVSVLYFQQQQKKLYIGSFERGIFVYDMLSQEIIRPEADLSDVNITRIRPLNETELLVATEGMGVYKLDMNKCILERYISANYQSYNEMNGDNINDVFVDESKRIWLANYPTGITVIDYRYENYHWMKHSMGNKQSIVNDQVHAVIEDSDGDLWFGTSNGISLYNSGTGEWHSFLSSFNHQLKDKNQIVPGQALLLLEVDEGQAEESTQPELAKGKTIGGYAYPFIDKEILEQSFPALKELLVFSYGFTFEGNLVPPLQDDLWMIETAWRHGAKPIMVLTPFSEGAFNNQLVKVLTENVEVQERLLEQLTAEVRRRGFAGVNIDFEYVLPENKVQYAAFIGKMRELLRPEGYTVSVAVPPKVSNEQRGLLVEGADYRLIGENADYVFLMTYEWGYTYGPPMAVAPLDKVRQVVEYALSQIPAEKLILGIPNYGYDWQLPYERGVTRAQTIGNVQAVDLAVENGALIRYAQTAQSPWFTYKKSGMDHVVWFEDVRSIQAKWKLVQELDLAGAWYWNLMRKFRGNWLMLESPDAGRNT